MPGQAARACLSFCGDGRIVVEQPASDLEKQTSLDLLVTGKVQGVGFRYFAHAVACQYGLVGYVVNLGNGSVRAYVEGPRRAAEEFRRRMEQGPGGSRVQGTHTVWGLPTGQHTRFVIDSTR